MKTVGANHCYKSQCLRLSLQMEFTTNECFDCSISSKHLTGFQVPGAVTSQSLSSLLTSFHPPEPPSVFAHTGILLLCLPQQTGYREGNQCRLISVPLLLGSYRATQHSWMEPLYLWRTHSANESWWKFHLWFWKGHQGATVHTLCLKRAFHQHLRGELVHPSDTGIADLRQEARTMKVYTTLKSTTWHPSWKRRYPRLCCNVPGNTRSLSLEAWWAHTTRIHCPQQPKLWVLGQRICAVNSKEYHWSGQEHSLSAKQGISSQGKCLLSLTHARTKTCCSPPSHQNDLWAEAGTLWLRITIWQGQRELVDTYKGRTHAAPHAPNRAFHFRGPHADESSKSLLQSSLCFVFPLCQLWRP